MQFVHFITNKLTSFKDVCKIAIKDKNGHYASDLETPLYFYLPLFVLSM